jgi:hypothetical protein
MHHDNDDFEVLSGREMRAKYYPEGEVPPLIKLDPRKVPVQLRGLIPLAERWGISDDILRVDFVSKASPESLRELRESVDKHRKLLNEWLGGPEADNPPFSEEYLAFTHMFMAADDM